MLNKARDDAGNMAQQSLRDTNNVVRMVTAGSKGSFINISQVWVGHWGVGCGLGAGCRVGLADQQARWHTGRLIANRCSGSLSACSQAFAHATLPLPSPNPTPAR